MGKIFGSKVKTFYGKDISTQRLEVLAVEIALAGGQVLQDQFGFTTEQVAKWVDALLEQAKFNREGNLKQMQKVVDGIDHA